MGLSITEKIIKSHAAAGSSAGDGEIALRIDQTLTQDSTGTMAYLQLEALGISRVRTQRSVAYVDHNTLQTGPENADDHAYIRTVASKYGIYFSRPGNGICHQVHLERFAAPGLTLLGSDSHTPTAGGMGVLAIGAGGLDVAVAMAGEPYYLKVPVVCRIDLKGALPPWVSAKDIILALLRRLTVKGGVGKIFEYGGDGASRLTVPERATITNMGAELGATTSLFPSDEETLKFMRAQNRAQEWTALQADDDAVYDERIELDLGTLEPLAAQPHSPDNVDAVKNMGSPGVDQVIVGSCTNSSLPDMMKVASILKGKKVHKDVSFVLAPGSRQVLNMLAQNGMLADIVGAGARVLECACGPCIGMGQAPATNGVSLRTFNRNFQGRSGTPSAEVYLVSPEVAAVSALTGQLTDPREYSVAPQCTLPATYAADDSMIVPPASEGSGVRVIRGPNIKPFPVNTALPDVVRGPVLIKLGDNITTDHIMPSYAGLLPYRSNIPYLADYCLVPCDSGFASRARANGGGVIVGGSNYGQGSSREHAALVPLYLGVKAVIAKSFARIHRDNLINNGIIPLVLQHEHDYDSLAQGDMVSIEDAPDQISGGGTVVVRNAASGADIACSVVLSDRQREMILAGGLLNAIRNRAS